MYIHAYQSYVWNAVVSHRIRVHGAEKPAVGDIVFDTGPAKVDEVDDDATMEDVDAVLGDSESIVEKGMRISLTATTP